MKKSTTKTVNVHIVTFNSDKYIIDCITSVLNQTYPIKAIIVVDNASQDQTIQLLKQYSNICLIENKVNKGFAGGHNQAIRSSSSDYYLVLNPDVVLAPNYLDHLIREAESLGGHIGALTGKLLFKAEPNIVDSTGIVLTKSRRAFDRGVGDDQSLWNESGPIFGVSGAAALYSKEMVEDISIEGCFFDEDFFAYKEDVDVAWRSQLLGWTSYYCSIALAYHDRGWKKGDRKSVPLFVRRLSYINRYKMILKNDSLRNIIKNFVPFFSYELASLSYFLVREPKVLTIWIDFFKKFGCLIRKRKIVKDKISRVH